MCLSAVGASQHRGQACRGAATDAAARLHPNTCGAFHGSGPSNFSGKLHIFHGHSPAREDEEWGGGLAQGEADDGL